MGNDRQIEDYRNFSQNKVDELLAANKNVSSRTRKACYPCNKRKVKCDRELHQPCSSCSKRAHPELCFYEPGSPESIFRLSQKRKLDQPEDPLLPRSGLQIPTGSPTVASAFDSPTEEWNDRTSVQCATIDNRVTSRDSGLSSIHAIAFPTHELSPTNPNSMAALVQDRANTSPQANSVNIQPLFGLRDLSAPYPFVQSGGHSNWKCIESSLPHPTEIIKFFHCWKSVHSPFQAIISDIDAVDIRVCNLIETIGEHRSQVRFDALRGLELQKELAWLGLLFTVLALGAQCSDLHPTLRSSTSQEYTRKAFDYLRLANFLSRPSETSIQTLLLLGIVLQNDFQPDAAWAMIGTTIRLAQSVGLNTSDQDMSLPEPARSRKQRLWWAVVWQDTLLSACFGTSSNSFFALGEPPVTSSVGAADFTFVDAMYAIVKITADTLNPSQSCTRLSRVITALSKIENLNSRMLPRLVSKTQCRNIAERLEFHTFSIHRNFIVSYFLQLAIRETDSVEERPKLIQQCKVTTSTAAKAFIDLAAFSVLPLRLWSLLHNALSSSLLRGFLGESDQHVRETQRAVLTLLRKMDDPPNETASKLSERHSRALELLEFMSRQTGDVDALQLDEVLESRVPSRSIDESRIKQDSYLMQSNDMIPSPDTFWNSYFANPVFQESGYGSDSFLQPDLWDLGL